MNIFRLLLIILSVFAFSAEVSAQKFFTKDGQVRFESDAPLEKIEARNGKGTCVWDTESGALEMAVLVKGFKFEKALMEEHFNENYMESDKFPKAVFKGKVVNMEEIDISKDGEYNATLSGNLTLHGVTNAIESPATFKVSGSSIAGMTSFEVAVADYGIEIPKLVSDNIAKIVKIDVDVDFKPLNK